MPPLTGVTRNGLPVEVFADVYCDPSPRFTPNSNISDIILSYKQNGYVIISGLYDRKECASLRHAWSCVKQSSRFLYRQASGFLEKNIFNDDGYVSNPILNIQSLDGRFFAPLRGLFDNVILASPVLASVTEKIVEDDPLVVQSMYFEGNSITWEHQDSYYLDDARIGMMAGAWIALEDIHPTAGRFFVIPKSHLNDLSDVSLAKSHSTNHSNYIRSIVDNCISTGCNAIAPAMEAGDVLIWNSLTIHGSLQHEQPGPSRSSITLHIIGNNSKLLSHRTRLSKPSPKERIFRNLYLYRPKDQRRLINRLIYHFEIVANRPFRFIKRAINHINVIFNCCLRVTVNPQ